AKKSIKPLLIKHTCSAVAKIITELSTANIETLISEYICSDVAKIVTEFVGGPASPTLDVLVQAYFDKKATFTAQCNTRSLHDFSAPFQKQVRVLDIGFRPIHQVLEILNVFPNLERVCIDGT